MTRIPFDPDAIRALAAVLAETGLSEIEIAEKDSRIRVVRATAPMAVAPIAVAPAAVAAARASKFTPTKLSGQPVKVNGVQPPPFHQLEIVPSGLTPYIVLLVTLIGPQGGSLA